MREDELLSGALHLRGYRRRQRTRASVPQATAGCISLLCQRLRLQQLYSSEIEGNRFKPLQCRPVCNHCLMPDAPQAPVHPLPTVHISIADATPAPSVSSTSCHEGLLSCKRIVHLNAGVWMAGRACGPSQGRVRRPPPARDLAVHAPRAQGALIAPPCAHQPAQMNGLSATFKADEAGVGCTRGPPAERELTFCRADKRRS